MFSTGLSEIQVSKRMTRKNPLGVYGRTKLDMKIKNLESDSKFCIIRTSWLFSEFGNNFLKTILNLASKKNEISVISDQIPAPTYSGDISKAIIIGSSFIKMEILQMKYFIIQERPFCLCMNLQKTLFK